MTQGQKCLADCKDMNGIKKTLYGSDGAGGVVACSKKLDRNKVGWKALAIIVGIFFPIITVVYWNVRAIDAEEVKTFKIRHESEMSEVKAIAADQALEVNKIKILQQVIIKNQDDFKKQFENQQTQREKDHRTVMKQQEVMKQDILKAIRRSK